MTPPPLEYRSPRTDDPIISWHGGMVLIELGPMPAGLFVIAFFPLAVVMILVLLVSALVVWNGHLPIVRAVAATFFVLIALWFAVLVHRRSTPRRVWASAGELGFADFKNPVGVRIHHLTRYSPVEVGICPWAPWACRLVIRAGVDSFMLSDGKQITLAIDDSRDRLQQAADAIERARVQQDNAPVRGAFEVIFKDPKTPK